MFLAPIATLLMILAPAWTLHLRRLTVLAVLGCATLLGACGQRGPLILPPKPLPGFVPPPIPASVKAREEEERKKVEAEKKRREEDALK